jgi:hypothetical protein
MLNDLADRLCSEGTNMTDLEFYLEKCGGDTIGDFIRAVLRIDNPEDARRFYQGCVAYTQAQIDSGKWEARHTPIEAANANIGWCFGEGMAPERITMWREVSGACHPVFGISLPSSPQAAFDAGVQHARNTKADGVSQGTSPKRVRE